MHQVAAAYIETQCQSCAASHLGLKVTEKTIVLGAHLCQKNSLVWKCVFFIGLGQFFGMEMCSFHWLGTGAARSWARAGRG